MENIWWTNLNNTKKKRKNLIPEKAVKISNKNDKNQKRIVKSYFVNKN